jgi:hypothetical protein
VTGAPPEVSPIHPLQNLTRDDLAEVGLYAVTDPQFGNCVGNGVTDCTSAIQSAIRYAYQQSNFASAQKGVVYFPPGEYLITETLSAYTDRHRSRNRGIQLVGSTAGEIPQIILAANRFNDQKEINNRVMDGSKKAMIHFYSCFGPRESDPESNGQCRPAYQSQAKRLNRTDGQTAMQMSSGIRNLHFIVRDGNPDAIAIRFAGAQHNILSNVQVTMLGQAFAGLYSIPGTNSVLENITISGGQIGIHGGTTLWPSINNLRLYDQQYLALGGVKGGGPVAINGFEIIKDRPPAISDSIVRYNFSRISESGGAYALSDGVISFRESGPGPAIDNTAQRQLTLQNVTFENSSLLVDNGSSKLLAPNPTLSRVEVYANVVPGRQRNKGARVDQTVARTDNLIHLDPDPTPANSVDLLRLHGLDKERLPSPDVILALSKAGHPAYAYVGHNGINAIAPNVSIDS